jgi:release factor glutamine methyltransferase
MLRQRFYARLSPFYLQGELQSLYHWSVQEIHGWSRAEVYARNEEEVGESVLSRWESVMERLAKSEPIQYIFNKASFFDLVLYVNESVLIPRPETEELVQLLLDENSAIKCRVLDIGTGSGCIPFAIKKARPNWTVSGCDISEGALEVAKKNGEKLGLDIHFFQADAKDLRSIKDTDIIVSNPPYIPIDRKETLETNVLNYEPHLALFSPESDPYYFFRIITQVAVASGVKQVYFETHATEMDELTNALSQIWKGSIKVVKDLGGKERFVVLNFE